MANNCLDTRYRRTKFSVSKKGPPLRSWFWVILVKCFIGLPCIFSKCLGVDITVAIYPKETLPIRYGDPLELFCVAENCSSDDLEFSIGRKVLESERINETTRRLYIKNPEIQSDTYYCRNIKNNKTCSTRVLVDTPPVNATNFSCISEDVSVLKCSWSFPNSYSVMNNTLTFAVNGKPVSPPCIGQTENVLMQTYYCVWNTHSTPRYRQQLEILDLHLTSCNAFGCNHQNFTIDHFSIVKPAAPTNLNVGKIKPHSVLLKWDISNNMGFLSCGVEHIIEYRIVKIDNTTYFHRVDASSLSSKKSTYSYKFKLNNLPYAHMKYEVRVYVKSKNAVKREFWSNNSYDVFYTAGERPQRPPDMVPGAFHQAIWDESRNLCVYWKQLEEYEEAGANFTYKVLVAHGNRTFPIMTPDKNKSLSYVILEGMTLEALDVTVWSFNDNGSSIESSHQYIPASEDTLSLSLTSFSKLAYENGTYELTWVKIDNIDNYTLFWCHHNTTKICSGRMDFAVLNSTKSSHVINLPNEYRYQFAIAANNGTKTSGMIWAMCDISKDGFVMYRFPAELKYDAPGKSSVHLRWTMDCPIKEGIIIGYNISYCPIVQTSSNCDKSFKNQYKYISNPKQMHVLIEGLFPSRTYQFNLSVNTTFGQKRIENATAVITTSQDTPTSPINAKIYDIQNDSLVISWDPPIQRNGNIGKYVIYNYGTEFYVDSVSGTDVSRRNVTLNSLQSFTNYSFSVQACNIGIGLCSKPGPSIFVRTRIGPPSMLKAPIIRNNPDKLEWDPPTVPGGIVDLYQVKRVRDDSIAQILNTTDLFYSLTHCEGVVSSETYQVRAVNLDDHLYHGVMGSENVTLPQKSQTYFEFPGEWSLASSMTCRNRGGMTMIFIFVGIFLMFGMVFGSIKVYKKYRKMEDIKPVLPNGLGIPEKDISKYTFAGWNPTNKEEKPSSDEMLLLPNSKATVPPPENKQKDDNCAASDHTDSTALSDSSRCPVEKQASTSDDGSTSSLHLETEPEPVKTGENNAAQDKDSFIDNTESSCENSPYFTKAFTKNPTSGYVQPVVNPPSGYVQSAPAPVKSPPPTTSSQPAGSSYVMAALSPPIFTTGVVQPPMANTSTPSSGYVLAEEAQARSMMEFPKLGPSPTKVLGPESLPTMPTLPPPTKYGADNSYIQLQSLDALPSLKSQVRNTVPLKPPASSGYVSPGDVVINKHLNNMLSGSQLAEESAILDPTMSPDAYCRFSWSTDPVNDNLHSLLADSTTRTSSNN